MMAASLPAPLSLAMPDIGEGEMRRVAELTRSVAGIDLRHGKEGLVRSRLGKRLRELALPDFAAYLRFVEEDASRVELKEMIDALTTNKTSFFREPHHFDYLRDVVLPFIVADRHAPRLWSAGCS